MNTTDQLPDYRLTHQQQRFCDEYLTHFNAFKAAVNSGYSENTSRKGALLHVPKIQQYLKERMAERSRRLEITHDMLLRELSKIAFSNMGNYYDEYACLKRINQLTVDEKAAIASYDIVEIQDGDGYRVGMQSKIKLHNKMSALDKIARHLNFYGTVSSPKSESPEVRKEVEAGGLKQEVFSGEESGSGESESPEEMALVRESVVVDKNADNLPMDYAAGDVELEGIELKTLVVLEDVDVSPGRSLMIEGLDDRMIEWEEERKAESGKRNAFFERETGGLKQEAFCRMEHGVEDPSLPGREPDTALPGEGIAGKVENILTISPLESKGREVGKSGKTESEKRLSDFRTPDFRTENALRMGADTGCAVGSRVGRG